MVAKSVPQPTAASYLFLYLARSMGDIPAVCCIVSSKLVWNVG